MRWTKRVLLCVLAFALLGLLATGCMKKADPAETAAGPAATKAPPKAPDAKGGAAPAAPKPGGS